MEFPLLQDIVIILGLSVPIILVFQKLKMPSILGFLLTGLIAGPHGLSLIHAQHEVEILAEIGVIFLLFVIGIEFSLKGLASIKNIVLWGGSLQVFGTILATALVTKFMGLPWSQAVFMGFLLSLSSTAIVLKLLQAKAEITAPHGRIAVAILIFQDIIVVPMMLLTPIISGQTDNIAYTLLLMAAKVVGVIGLVILLARYLVPTILTLVVKTRSKELFILTIIVLCFATAWLTSSVGLSLALGAFFAGLVISESDYSHQATANILPFREIFISFFFVSIGMLLDLGFFLSHLPMVILLTVGVVLLKAHVIAMAVIVLRYPPRTVLLTAFSLFQVGEFAFLLSTVGLQNKLLDGTVYQYFLAISILTMAATPFVFEKATTLTDFLLKRTLSSKVRRRLERRSSLLQAPLPLEEQLNDHLIIIGYGINGKNVARAAKNAEIPYLIIELNPDTVKTVKAEGEPIMYGDASQDLILQHVHIQDARVVVIAISDPDATKKIVAQIREFSKTVYIIVRTRYVSEIEQNLRLGADEIIPEEFETSIEIFTRVLKKYLVPTDQVEAFINYIRSQNYEMLRTQSDRASLPGGMQLSIPDVTISTLPVYQGNNKIVGKTLADSGLRQLFGVTVLALKRGNHFETNLSANQTIEQDDVLYVFGTPDNISALNNYLEM